MPTESLTGRVVAGLAGIAVLVGAALIWAALRGQDPAGYISEAGDPTAAHPRAYAAGVLALAAALLLLAVALVMVGPAAVAGSPRWPLRLAPALLVLAATGATTSGAVQCSPGCPLPPYEQPTVADLVHAGASIAAVGLFGLAVGVLALSPRSGWLRGSARVAFLVVAPLGLAILVLMLSAGRSPVTAGLERAMVGAGLAWTLFACLVLATRPASTRPASTQPAPTRPAPTRPDPTQQ